MRGRAQCGGAARAMKPSAPRWVAPNDSPCRHCSTGSSARGGSSAIALQRTNGACALRPISSVVGPTGRRPDIANSAISATTPSATALRSRRRRARPPASRARRSRNRRRGSPGSGSPPRPPRGRAVPQQRSGGDRASRQPPAARCRAAPARRRPPWSPQRATISQIRSPRGDEIEQDAGAEAAGNEGRRAPQPHRAIAAPCAAQAAQRIGVGQRHHRRVEGGGERESRHDGERPVGKPDRAVPNDGRRRRDHDRHCAARHAGRRRASRPEWRTPARSSESPARCRSSPASSPLAASQTGRNGSCTPSATHSAA